jgi:hypothetical protein
MPDLYKEVILELEKRKVADARDIGPFYISSMATHMLNIVNQTKRIYTEGGLPANLRQHILYVAPPGFGKSYYVKQFVEHEDYSLLKGVNSFPAFFEGSMTEAGLVGSIDPASPGQAPKKMYGLAGGEGANAIVAMEEFAAITNAMVQDYNVNLDTALLTLLDSGIVNKRLRNGDLKYNSNMTWWAGTQPARFDLSSGLARRFIFVVKYPVWNDFKQLSERRRAAKNVKRTVQSTKMLHDLLDQRFMMIRNNVSSITFHDDFYKIMDKKRIIHYEEALYERLAIGYWLMKENNLNGPLEVRVDPELERIIALEHGHRKDIKQGAIQSMVWNIIKDLPEIGRKELLDKLLDLSLDYDESTTILNRLLVLKYLHYDADRGVLIPIRNKK